MKFFKSKEKCLIPSISVIVPVYNSENTLERCLMSILSTKSVMEIICVNDGSKDSSLKILKKMKKKHNSIRIISFKRNMGLYCARIEGVLAAKAEYIGFLDSDDYVLEGYFDKLLLEITNSGADIAVGQIVNQGIDGIKYIQTRCAKFPYKEDNIDSIYNMFWQQAGRNYHWHVVWNKVYKKELWLKQLSFLCDQKQHLIMMEDFIFSSVVLSATKKYVVDTDAKYVYVENEKSTIHNMCYDKVYKNIQDMKNAFDIVDKFINSNKDFSKYNCFFDEWKQRYTRYWKRNIENMDLSDFEKKDCIKEVKEISNQEIGEVSFEDEYFYEESVVI